MRLFAGIAAAAVVIAACGGTAAAPSPSPTLAPTLAPTVAPTPTPTPTPANTFKAELKASNENPPITDAEATCAGTATVTFTATSAKFDVSITGCPASTAINIGHIHEGAAGVNGPVKIDSTLKAGDIALTAGAVTFSRTNTAADPALITAVMANPAGYYVNFHSTLHAGGVIRGQLTKG
ncbi:MAG: CHRD domain-containing protein [Chloroflexi bacterium]|nr:MAG: CHRD domain-containing protein [Chloroflexota bacterium]